jgi:FkbM family methyltransferase
MLKYIDVRPIHAFRWFFFKHLTNRRYITCPVHDREMTLDLRVGGISRALSLYGTREEDMLKIIRDRVKPGMHILDLGANIGYYTLEFSSLIGREGLLLAVEPDPRNFAVLQKNVDSLKMSNVIYERLAVSNIKGVAKMAITEKSNLNTLAVTAGHANCDLIEVETETISSIVKTYLNERLDFIRMDIEGFEYEALMGLREYLDARINKPIILFEVHPMAYGGARDMKGLLQNLVKSYNYRIETIVSTNGGKRFFDSVGISPGDALRSDGFLRYFYYNLPDSVALEAILQNPKCVRYALMV